MIWEFTRWGTYYSDARIAGHDHDFADQAEGKVVPFGIYDIQQNKWTMILNMSHDTSELNCNAIKTRWLSHGKHQYPSATEIVILNDCWWSNGVRSLLYKYYLQCLSNEINMRIRIAHYPPYTSKYNPIEHRMFCHVHQSCEWAMFTSLEVVKELIAKTYTKTWLSVNVSIDRWTYETKKKIPKIYEQLVRNIPDRDALLPQRNYVVNPNKEYLFII